MATWNFSEERKETPEERERRLNAWENDLERRERDLKDLHSHNDSWDDDGLFGPGASELHEERERKIEAAIDKAIWRGEDW